MVRERAVSRGKPEVAAAKGRRLGVMVGKEEVIGDDGQRKPFRGSGGQRKKSEDSGEGECTRNPSFPSGFPWQGGFRPGEQPQGAGAGECREGDSLALGLRPGSFDSSQN